MYPSTSTWGLELTAFSFYRDPQWVAFNIILPSAGERTKRYPASPVSTRWNPSGRRLWPTTIKSRYPPFSFSASVAASLSSSSVVGVFLKPKLSVRVIIYLILSGPGCFWPSKGTSLPKTFFTKITRALSNLRRMVAHPAGRSLATLTFVIFSGRTVSSPRASPSSTVPRMKCLPISLQNLSKAVCYGNSGPLFLVIAM